MATDGLGLGSGVDGTIGVGGRGEARDGRRLGSCSEYGFVDALVDTARSRGSRCSDMRGQDIPSAADPLMSSISLP